MKVNTKIILTIISFVFGVSFFRLLRKQKQTQDKLQDVKKEHDKNLSEYKDYKKNSEKLFKLEREIINNLEKKAFKYDFLKEKYDYLQNSFKELYKQSQETLETKEETKKTAPPIRTEFKDKLDEVNYKKELANYFNIDVRIISNWFYKPKNRYKGVLYRENHFEAQLQFNNITLSKCFKTEIEAALQYNKWVDEYRLGYGFKNIILEEIKKIKSKDNKIHFKPKGKYKNASSSFFGVVLSDKERGIFKVQIYLDKQKKIYLGYGTEIECAKIYNDYVIKNNLDRPLNIIPEDVKQENKPEQLSIIEQKNFNPDFEKIAKEFNIPTISASVVESWYSPPKPPQKYKGVCNLGKSGYKAVLVSRGQVYYKFTKTEELAAAEYNALVREHRKGYGYLNKIEGEV